MITKKKMPKLFSSVREKFLKQINKPESELKVEFKEHTFFAIGYAGKVASKQILQINYKY
ncbi:MAG: hypothetical protein OHK0057_34970 [Thermoflexibacter sp.]